MNENILIICGSDTEYIRRLQENLAAKKDFPFQVDCITDLSKLGKGIKKAGAEILLAEREWYESCQKISEEGILILLKEEEMEENVTGIYKYQSGEKIKKEILKIYSEENTVHGELSAKKKSQIIGFYSPVKRCYQTSFAMTLGMLLAREKSVLYINLETYSGMEVLSEGREERDITDLIYFMLSGTENLIYKLKSMVLKKNGMDYIVPAMSFEDLMSVKEEDWLKLIKILRESSGYDYILLDMSEGVQGLFSLLEKCRMVYMLTKKDELAKAKICRYEQLMQRSDREEIMRKTKQIEIPKLQRQISGMNKGLYSDLADYVRKIKEEDFCDAI